MCARERQRKRVYIHPHTHMTWEYTHHIFRQTYFAWRLFFGETIFFWKKTGNYDCDESHATVIWGGFG